MGNRISSSILTTNGVAAKLALGAASFMLLTIVGSATIAGATPATGANETEGTTSLKKDKEKENNGKHLGNVKGDNGKHLGNDKDNNHEDRGNHGYGGGEHGYGGDSNSIHTNITNNQTGNDNIFSVIINYIFG